MRLNSMIKDKTSRREFFRGLCRWSSLGGILGGGGYLAFHRGDPLSEPACINQAICSTCGQKDGCPLPPALSRRAKNAENSTTPQKPG